MTKKIQYTTINLTNKVDPINALRVFATLIVFVAHTNIFSNAVLYTGKWSFFLNAPAWAAMWIFYTLSGYLAGKNFTDEKYSFTFRSIGVFYYKKILKIWLPTMFFILIACVLAFQDFLPNNFYVIKNFFLCTYGSARPNAAVDGVGATWFVFTLMWLYLSAPLLSFIAEKIKDCILPHKNTTWEFTNKRRYVLCVFYLILTVLCLILGEVWRQYIRANNMDWMYYVYTPPYANISMFAAGTFFAYFLFNINTEKKNIQIITVNKILSVTIMFGTVLMCCYMFYKCGVEQAQTGFWVNMLESYKYTFPTIFSIFVLYYLYAFDTREKKSYAPLTLENVAENPLRLIDAFAGISFEFYLIHSLILNRICNYLRDPYPVQEFLKLLIATFVISCIFAYAFQKSIKGIYQSTHITKPMEFCKQNKKSIFFILILLCFICSIILLITQLPY